MKNNIELVGYDLDGTICQRGEMSKSFFHCNGSERKAFYKGREHHYRTTEVIRTPSEKQWVIITSRKNKYRKITLDWLVEKNLKPKQVYFMEGYARVRREMIEYKSKFINDLELCKYYEDDPKIVSALKKRCPNTQIVLVDSIAREVNIKDFENNTLLLS